MFGLEGLIILYNKGWDLLPYLFKTKKTINLDGKFVHFSTKDIYSKSWFYPRYKADLLHEPSITKIIHSLMNENHVFYDVGSHLGYFACVAQSSLAKGEIHIFEMDERMVSRIEENINLNRGKSNVTINNIAITHKVGKINFSPKAIPNPGQGIKTISSGKNQISSISLDEYIAAGNRIPDLIKIDIEGAEMMALKGLELNIQRIPQIIIEIHPKKLPEFESNYKEVLNWLDKYGYIQYLIPNHKDVTKSELKFSEIDKEGIFSKTFVVWAIKKEEVISSDKIRALLN